MVAVSSCLRRGVIFQRAVQSLLAPNVATKATIATRLSSTGVSSSKLSKEAKPCTTFQSDSRLLSSTVEISADEVETSRSSDVLVSKEDQHKEEKIRTRISDVRPCYCIV